MANNMIDEALKQASGNNNQEIKSTPKSQESNPVTNDRISDIKTGYRDGVGASFDYIEGFRRGLKDGIVRGREQVLNEFRQSLNEAYGQPLTIDLDQVCGNFPVIEFKPNLQLPKGN